MDVDIEKRIKSGASAFGSSNLDRGVSMNLLFSWKLDKCAERKRRMRSQNENRTILLRAYHLTPSCIESKLRGDNDNSSCNPNDNPNPNPSPNLTHDLLYCL